jgi:hypothetical protein
VGLLVEADAVDLGPGQYVVSGSAPEKRVVWTKAVRFHIAKGGFLVRKARWGKKVFLKPKDPQGTVLVNGRPYRGGIELERTRNPPLAM